MILKSYIIKVYHSFEKGKSAVSDFLNDIHKTLSQETLIFGLHYKKGHIFYSYHADGSTVASFESQFYTQFNDFQLIPSSGVLKIHNKKKKAIAGITFENKGFFPFKMDDDDTDFVFNMLRSFENFDVIKDSFSYFIEIEPVVSENFNFIIKQKIAAFKFRIKLFFSFYKYMFGSKAKSGRKSQGRKQYTEKMDQNLFRVKIFMIASSDSYDVAVGRIKSVYNNFRSFKNYPYNKTILNIFPRYTQKTKTFSTARKRASFMLMTGKEFSQIFQFPRNPKTETSLMTVKSEKLSLPIGLPTFEYTLNKKREVIPNTPSKYHCPRHYGL